jgi:hypothetical protein
VFGPSFSLGANLPWINYGGDFGANAWRPRGGLAATGIPPDVRDRIAELPECGVETLRWFVFCDGRAGVRFKTDSEAAGLDGYVLDDFHAALEFAGSLGISLVPTLLDFSWCSDASIVDGVQTGGRSEALATPANRRLLLERVIAPVLARFGRDSSIAAWDLMNEPEWAARRIGQRAVRAFITETASLAHQLAAQSVTVGLASTRGLPLVRDAGLDFYQVHWYDSHRIRTPLDRPVATLGFDKPVVLGEFPTAGSACSPEHIVSLASGAGYSAAWFWSVLADDDSTDWAAIRTWFAGRSIAAGRRA